MGLSTSEQREDNSCRQCHGVHESMIIMLSELNRNKKFLLLSLKAWNREYSGCDGTAFQHSETGTKYVATPCEVCGAQGLRRIKSCDVSGWRDVCPP